MRVLMLLLVSISITINVLGQHNSTKGMQFEHDLFNLVLAKAKANEKAVFVDCYTTWCGPCKWMSANVFTNDTVGMFYNHFFVNLKQDMERGEGPQLSQRFQISAYPTYVFLKPDGNVFYRSMGAMPADKFIGVAKEALGAEANLDSLKNRYLKGNKSAKNLLGLVVLSYINKLNYDNYLIEYFKTQQNSNLTNNKNFEVIKTFSKDISSTEIQYFIKNKSDYEKLYGADVVNATLLKIASENAQSTDKKRNKLGTELLQKLGVESKKQ